ncbi:MAG: YggS family pyridoxal phosphate-dependent enzyme [Peptococcaceae bacterium]|nr:YggS family pyridoxal phosphate-dependent enzyme [Peptococcaceae bacterium]
MSIANNIGDVRQKIFAAAARSGRDPRAVKLLAVTKTVAIPDMNQALALQVNAFGENRVQELLQKYPQFPLDVEWHLIGHLQTNKVRQIIDKLTLLHSLDRLNLAKAISDAAQGRIVPVLLQVNVARETTKYGMAPEEVMDFLSEISSYQGLAVQGLMTMAPFVANPEEARPVFRGLADLAQKVRAKEFPGVVMRWLSMGMTNDFEVAIEEGANLVRVGSGIFGTRN